MKKVLTIGGATQDIFLHYESPESSILDLESIKKNCLILEQGSKIDVKKINYYTGGGATNAAISFIKLGFSVSCIVKIGIDLQGEFILNELKNEGIACYESYSKQNQTATSFILPTESDRIVFAFRGANKDLKENDIPIDLINKTDLIYITSLSGESYKLLSYITKIAQTNNKKVAVNPGIGQLKKEKINELIESLKNIDILILNANEAKTFMSNLLKQEYDLIKRKNISIKKESDTKNTPELLKEFIYYSNSSLTIADFFSYILHKGPSIIAVTNGSEGVYVCFENNIYFQKSIIPQQIVNTLGAGDAFGSCFVASLLNQKSIEDSIFYGVINSSSVIVHEGAKTGLLNSESLERKEKELIDLKKIQKFGLLKR